MYGEGLLTLLRLRHQPLAASWRYNLSLLQSFTLTQVLDNVMYFKGIATLTFENGITIYSSVIVHSV